jgi:hypothetical protein
MMSEVLRSDFQSRKEASPRKTETQNFEKDWVSEERTVGGAGKPCLMRLRLWLES